MALDDGEHSRRQILKERILELLSRRPQPSDHEIAALLGCTRRYVRMIRKLC